MAMRNKGTNKPLLLWVSWMGTEREREVCEGEEKQKQWFLMLFRDQLGVRDQIDHFKNLLDLIVINLNIKGVYWNLPYLFYILCIPYKPPPFP